MSSTQNSKALAAEENLTALVTSHPRTHWGRLVESAVGARLFNTAFDDYQVQYWRESPDEVDFVLTNDRKLVAIEVKSGINFTAPKGLRTFAEKFKKVRQLVVGDGGVPIAEFLSRPAKDWLE